MLGIPLDGIPAKRHFEEPNTHGETYTGRTGALENPWNILQWQR
jgi:hypothetical protein